MKCCIQGISSGSSLFVTMSQYTFRTMCKRLRCALAIITVYTFNLAFSCSKVANLEYQLTIEPGVNLSDYNCLLPNTIN